MPLLAVRMVPAVNQAWVVVKVNEANQFVVMLASLECPIRWRFSALPADGQWVAIFTTAAAHPVHGAHYRPAGRPGLWGGAMSRFNCLNVASIDARLSRSTVVAGLLRSWPYRSTMQIPC